MVGDKIKFDVITQRTQETLVKYVLKINRAHRRRDRLHRK